MASSHMECSTHVHEFLGVGKSEFPLDPFNDSVLPSGHVWEQGFNMARLRNDTEAHARLRWRRGRSNRGAEDA
jgi:hypothetical protein